MSQLTEDMTGTQKSAVLCLALGPDAAGALLGQLEPDQLEAVTREMLSIDVVDPKVVEEVLKEYHSASLAPDHSVYGGMRAASTLLKETLGAGKAEALLSNATKDEDPPRLAYLEMMEPKLLANVLGEEHPQTVAVILAHLDMKFASETLEMLDKKLGTDVLFRMAKMDKIQPEVLSMIEDGLRGKAEASTTDQMETPGDAGKVAKILNMAPKGRDQEVLNEIGIVNQKLADRIRALMFVFEDLLLVDGKGIQRILRDLDSKDLSLALKGASPELKKHIRSNMSERAGQALEEEIELLGAVRISDVEAAQQRIMETVNELEEEGDVVVSRGGSDDEFIT
ncbi:MAG: flagellar motor switch protein FliG [Candidatus Eisenbacteria bacterium]|uniref:Flagellar motor switch protein FliG n=1 Tax=Eiseniibacteriota bacterium TaxID=2212470 RepID=A0A7Y2E6G7_UNCEI|nr:flagellar motor switch protein FliG [Candidatus Eisenbacteria bacterium]